jgi:hypothetical protein
MHQIDIAGMNYTDISAAELHVYFRGDAAATLNSYYTLVLPIKIGTGIGTDFFSSLGMIQRSRPTLASVLSEDTPMIMYRGTNLEGRVKDAKTACSNAVNKVNYLVALKPLFMLPKDLTRFKRRLEKEAVYIGPVVANEPIADVKLPLITYIPSLVLTTTKVKTMKYGYEETAQVKCRPLNRTRDIKGSKVFVGGPGEYRSLKDELDAADNATNGLQESAASTDVSSIETTLAIVLGVVIGVMLFSMIAWFWFKRTEKKFSINIVRTAYSKVKSAITKTASSAANATATATTGAAAAAATP